MNKIGEVKKILEETGKYWIGFVGDSITSCEWVHPNWRETVEYVLKEELQPKFADWRVPSWGIRCFNYGFDGATTGDILSLITNNQIPITNLDLVVVMVGINDPELGVSLKEHEENTGKITGKLDGRESVWATNIKPMNENEASKYESYVEIDKKHEWGKTRFINMFEEFGKLELDRLFTFRYEGKLDFIHPNQLGNAHIAKIILKEVFGVEFDPEKYIRENLAGEKYPGY
jgi:lysophospholipase L1-like esterase